MLDNHYNKNGLVFWSEQEILLRERLVSCFSYSLGEILLSMNPGFKMVRVEAPLLTPKSLISSNYTEEDVFMIEDLALRPETTMGSYAAAKQLLSGFNDIKYKPPIVVWQHGKSFRREQDQPTKYMRLKEFYQLEFQVLFSDKTGNDYYPGITDGILLMMMRELGPCRKEASDRLPGYSTETTDIICGAGMEVCSISRRTDYEGLKNIEVAIGTDRCVYQKNKGINLNGKS